MKKLIVSLIFITTIFQALYSNCSIFLLNNFPDNGSNSGILKIYVSGGTGNYNYSWSHGVTGLNLNEVFNLPSGLYCVTIQDVSDSTCIIDTCVFVSLDTNFCSFNNSFIIQNESYPNTFDGSILVNTTGGPSGQYFYLWNNGNTTNNITSLASGIYTLSTSDSLCNALGIFTYDTVNVGLDSSMIAVWPGDADNNGVVNITDIFPIGISYNVSGPIRVDYSPLWINQYSYPWNDSISILSLNNAMVDCNGDGIINEFDADLILINYQLTHSKSSSNNSSSVNSVPIFLSTSVDTIVMGDTIHLDVVLGEISNPIDSIYGIAFSVNFDESFLDTITNYVKFTKKPTSWFDTSGFESFNIQKKTSGKLNIGICRKVKHNTSGFGIIGHLEVVTADDISAKTFGILDSIHFEISDITAITYHLDTLNIIPENKTIYLTDNSTNIHQKNKSPKLNIFPNPTQHSLTVKSDEIIQKIEVYDAIGNMVLSSNKSDINQLDVSILLPGHYVIKVTFDNITKHIHFIKN